MPRNVGIQFARGKYIAFLDSDDLYTKTALEELSTLAEKYQADVVHTDNWFFLWNGQPKNEDDLALTDMSELTNHNNLMLSKSPINFSSDEPFLVRNDLAERVTDWINLRYRWGTCSSFCKRNFLVANQIFFPVSLVFEDMFFNFSALCLAEKYLRVTNSFYIVRPRMGSMMREKDKFILDEYFSKWLSSLNENFNIFEKFMTRLPFFENNPDYQYAVLEFLFQRMTYDAEYLQLSYAKIPTFQLNEIVKKEFHTDNAALSSYLFDTVNIYRLQIMNLRYEIDALKKSQQQK